jgi:hypothetical protein
MEKLSFLLLLLCSTKYFGQITFFEMIVFSFASTDTKSASNSAFLYES